MPIYLIVPLIEDSSKFDEAIVANIADPSSRYQLKAKRGWLVNFPGTTVELSYAVGVVNQDNSPVPKTDPAIIVPIQNYYGRGPTDMWEWISTRIDK